MSEKTRKKQRLPRPVLYFSGISKVHLSIPVKIIKEQELQSTRLQRVAPPNGKRKEKRKF